MISLGGHLTGLKLGPQVAENGNDGIGSFISRIDFFFFLNQKSMETFLGKSSHRMTSLVFFPRVEREDSITY